MYIIDTGICDYRYICLGGVFIRPDLTRRQQEFQKNLRIELERRRKNGEDVYIRGDRIYTRRTRWLRTVLEKKNGTPKLLLHSNASHAGTEKIEGGPMLSSKQEPSSRNRHLKQEKKKKKGKKNSAAGGPKKWLSFLLKFGHSFRTKSNLSSQKAAEDKEKQQSKLY